MTLMVSINKLKGVKSRQKPIIYNVIMETYKQLTGMNGNAWNRIAM